MQLVSFFNNDMELVNVAESSNNTTYEFMVVEQPLGEIEATLRVKGKIKNRILMN